MTPGIHLRKIGPVYLKAFDIDFSIKTSLNLTHDLRLVQITVNDFQQECATFDKLYPKVADHCFNLHLKLGQLAKKTAMELQAEYRHKSRRWVSLTSKGIWKAAPWIAATLGAAYQEVEIWNLKKQITDAKSKMVLTTNALLNITEVEYEAIEGKLNEVISKQQEVIMDEAVINYAENVELFLVNLKLKHETITDIQPTTELHAYIEPVVAKLPTITLPPIGDEVFRVNPVSKSIQDGIVIVSYTIPMVQTQNISAWLIIASQTNDDTTYILENNSLIQQIVVNEENNTFADISNHPAQPFSIMKDVTMMKMSNCLLQIFSNSTLSSCNITKMQTVEITELYDDLVVVRDKTDSAISITCDNKLFSLNGRTAIVNTTECPITTSRRAFVGHHFVNINTDEEEVGVNGYTTNSAIEPLSHSPLAQETRRTLKEKLESWTSAPDTGKLMVMILGCGLLLISISICIKCITQRHREAVPPPQWFPEYIGPIRHVPE